MTVFACLTVGCEFRVGVCTTLMLSRMTTGISGLQVPPLGRGSMYKKKIIGHLGLKWTHSGHNAHKNFQPPPPPAPQVVPRYRGGGDRGVKFETFIGRFFSLPK